MRCIAKGGRRGGPARAGVALLLVMVWQAACALNPATGKRQISLIDESQEIAIGRQADKETVAELGLYPDEKLQAYVSRLGKDVAAHSERPDLPWTFRVVDDPVVNAFALPGGFIYVTRGLMTHLNSEAELAGVVGHEIGHVTGRHGVNQMSKAQLMNLGLGLGSILGPDLPGLGGLVRTGLGLLMLKYGRDDELEADKLGVRYMVRSHYDAREMEGVFKVLERVGRKEGGGPPAWLSTHPDPGDRQVYARELAERKGRKEAKGFEGAKIGRDGYLELVDGMVFGEDPREGYFRGRTFIHPTLRFRVELPEGWKTSNSRASVEAVSAAKDAVVRISVSSRRTAAQAAEEFFGRKGIRRGQEWRREINGLAAVSAEFLAHDEQSELEGLAAFVEHEGKVLQLLCYGGRPRFAAYDAAVRETFASLRKVTDPKLVDVRPMRVERVKAERDMTAEEFAAAFPSSVSRQELALVNHIGEKGRYRAGQSYKRVTGGLSAN